MKGTHVALAQLLCSFNSVFALSFSQENGNQVKRQVQPSSDVKTIHLPTGATVRYKEPGKSGICETSPGVNSYSGFIDTSPTQHTFFWFFESRNDPANDPLTVWTNGGPGSDSLIGVFQGFGPCQISDDGSTKINPYSWNNVSNVLYLSQPIGTGFSYADLQPGSIDETTGVFVPADQANVTGIWPVVNKTTIIDTSEDAAVVAWNFVQAFYGALPTLSPKIKSKEFNFWTVSWGGHYGPAFMKYFKDQNDEIAAGRADGIELELKTLGLGNAYIDVATQGPYFPAFATNNTYNVTAYNATVAAHAYFSLDMPNGCLAQAATCQALQASGPRDALRDAVCSEAWHMCFDSVEGLYSAFSGLDRFDVRVPASEQAYQKLELPIVALMNTAEVQDAIGVASNYTPDSNTVTYAFFQSGDGALGGFKEAIGELVDAGVRVVMFNGDADYACNWKGGEAVSLAVNYTDAAKFAATDYQPFVIDGKEYGLVRQQGDFAFMRVYDSGHNVNIDQPEAALALFNRTIHGEDVATGSQHVFHRHRTSEAAAIRACSHKNDIRVFPC